MDLGTVPQGPALRVIFFAHLIPVVWATQYQWLPLSYTIYNLLFLFTLFWSLHSRDSEDAIFMSSAINVLSIILDAITIGIYYGTAGSNSFNTFMAITNLLLRPITSLVLLRFYNERAGRYSALNIPGFGNFGTTGTRGSYEDLDVAGTGPRTQPHQSIPSNHRPEPNSNLVTIEK